MGTSLVCLCSVVKTDLPRFAVVYFVVSGFF